MQVSWQKIRTNTRLLIGVFLFLIVLAAGTVAYFFRQPQGSKQVLSDQENQIQFQPSLEVSNEEADSLYNQVNKIMLLPDEKPKVSTIKGVDVLKQEPFFRNARDGDRVLVFEENKRAILYNPTEHRIIEVGRVEINRSPATPSGQTGTP